MTICACADVWNSKYRRVKMFLLGLFPIIFKNSHFPCQKEKSMETKDNESKQRLLDLSAN